MIDIRNLGNYTALTLAIWHRNQECVKLLLDAGAKMANVQNLKIPEWLKNIISTRQNVTRAIITFMGVMKRRFRLKCEATKIIGYRFPRDMIHKISFEMRKTRWNDEWHPSAIRRLGACDHICGNKAKCGHNCCKK